MPVPLQAAKNIELEPQYRSLKGRVSQNSGKIALYQTLSASPASIVGANAIAYGMMKVHRISSADAVKAYLQAWCRCRVGRRVLLELLSVALKQHLAAVPCSRASCSRTSMPAPKRTHRCDTQRHRCRVSARCGAAVRVVCALWSGHADAAAGCQEHRAGASIPITQNSKPGSVTEESQNHQMLTHAP